MKRRDTHSKLRGLNITRLLARDGDLCALCGMTLDRKIANERDPAYVTFDHIVPKAKGGGDTLSNLRLTHALCNSERRDGDED